MGKSKEDKEIEDFTEEEIKDYTILYLKKARRTEDRDKKIQDAINKVDSALKRKVRYFVTLRVLYEIWPDCISSVKETMQKESHYSEIEFINDDEDFPLFNSLLQNDLDNNLEEWKAEKKKKEKLRLQNHGQKECVKKPLKRHRTGISSKLPLKPKHTMTQPKLDTFAQQKVKQQEALVEEFYKLKDEFVKSSNKILEENDYGDSWPSIYEKYQSILPEDYDACTNEVLAELGKIFEEE